MRRDGADAPVLDADIDDLCLLDAEILLQFERMLHHFLIPPPVGLCAKRVHRRPLAAVEHTVLNAGRIRRFAESEAFAKICAAEKVLRELAFITALPASAVLTAQGASAQEAAAVQDEQVLVQGIADLVLVFPDHLELLDYKTDRRKTEADFLSAYRPQLNLYALAIDKRFAPKKVTYKGIYSLELGRLIEV